MKIGVNSFLWTAEFSLDHLPVLDRMRQAGFDGVEVSAFDFARFPAADIRRHAEGLGLGLTVCTAFTGEQSFITDDAAVRERTRQQMLLAIEKTAELGASTLAGPFLSAVG